MDLKIKYPTVDDLVELNKRAVAEIRVSRADRHLVWKRIDIEQTVDEVSRQEGDVYDKAVTLLVGLIIGHPFKSANKRTAFLAVMRFLEVNGEKVSVQHDAQILQGIREEFYTSGEIKKWLRGREIRKFKRF